MARTIYDEEINRLAADTERKFDRPAQRGGSSPGWQPETLQRISTAPPTGADVDQELAAAFADSSIKGMFDRRPPAREWIFNKLIPARVPMMFAASGGTGKGLVQVLLAISTACSRNFAGFEIARPRRVVLISREDDRVELERRIQATSIALWGDLPQGEDLKLLEQNLHVVDLMGVTGADIASLVAPIKRKAEEVGDVAMIFLDPLGKLLPESAELNTDGMRVVLDYADRIVRETGATTIVVHHHNKAGSDRLNVESITGHKYLSDLARIVIQMVEVEPGSVEAVRAGGEPIEGDLVELRVTKANYVRKGTGAYFERFGVEIEVETADGKVRTESVPTLQWVEVRRMKTVEDNVVDWLRRQPQPVTRGDMRKDCKKQCGGVNRIDQARKNLVLRGDVLQLKPVGQGAHLFVARPETGHYTPPEGYRVVPREGVEPEPEGLLAGDGDEL
jgi:hypothetical protein